jgi:hypothetical protein
VTTFEDPVALLLCFSAKPRLFGFAPLNPSRLPVDSIDVDDRQPGALPEGLRQRALARPGLANDHDPLHVAPLVTSLTIAVSGQAAPVLA